MTPKELERLKGLDEARRQINAGIDEAVVTLKGYTEFRDAVEDLLTKTPYAKPSGYDAEGLYGRLKNALNGRRHDQ